MGAPGTQGRPTAPAPEAPVGAAAVEPASPAASTAPATSGRQRVHNSYVWLGSLRAVGVVVAVLLVSSFSSITALIEAGTRGLTSLAAVLMAVGLALGAVVLLVGVVVLIHLVSYRHLWYEVGPEEFALYSGILNKKQVHVPYRRIQSVDQQASLLQRAFGVCNVTIDTAGGASNKAVLVPYLTKQQADTLRGELFARKQAGEAASAPVAAAAGVAPSATGAAAMPGNVLDAGEAVWDALGHGAFAGQAVEAGGASFEYGLSNKELVLTGLSNNTAFVVAVLTILGIAAQGVEVIGELLPGSERAVGSMASALGLAPLIAIALGVVVVVAVVLWAVSLASTCLAYGGFRARRRGDRVEVERGLLQHQIQGVSIARVQSVTVKQSFVRRLLGYCEVSLGKVDAAGSEDSAQKQSALVDQGLVVHPFVKVDRVPEILAGLVPEFADRPVDQQGLPAVALRRGLVRRCLWQGSGFWLAVAVGICQGAFHLMMGVPGLLDDPSDVTILPAVDAGATVLYVLAAVLLVLDAVGTVLWQRSSGFAVNRRFMTVTNGGLSVETVTFPRQKIQYGFAKANPLQRHAGTATINARTAAGVGGTTVRLVDVTREASESWLDWLRPHAAS